MSHHSSTAIAQPWPTSARFVDGELEVAGIAASELARGFGTPLQVIDEEDVRLRAARSRRRSTPCCTRSRRSRRGV